MGNYSCVKCYNTYTIYQRIKYKDACHTHRKYESYECIDCHEDSYIPGNKCKHALIFRFACCNSRQPFSL